MATAVVRGCGTRIAGGIYATCGLSEHGVPLESYLYDPPMPLDVGKLGVSQVGTRLIEQDGVWHILDWIGSEYYPNVADFLEEVRWFGLSRRLSSRLEFEKLTLQSRHLLIHSRARIINWEEYMSERSPEIREWSAERSSQADFRCPKREVMTHKNVGAPVKRQAEEVARLHQGIPGRDEETGEALLASHARSQECSALWWEDIEQGRVPEGQGPTSRLMFREMPSLGYVGLATPPNVEPIYEPALIARFPIQRLAVIRNTHDIRQQARAFEAARHSSIPVTLEEE